VPLAVAALALFYAVTSVAVASLTDRRIVGGLAFLGTMLIPAVIANAFVEAASPEGTILGLGNLLNLPLVLRDLVFEGHVDVDHDGGLGGVAGAGVGACVLYAAIVGTGLVVLHRRYRDTKP
jgi:hypothetical protein